jgi:predicted ATP-grasp superfamily ATP-dependent carboligase
MPLRTLAQMEIRLDRPLDRPVVVAAFEGWNDAGEAASTAVAHLAELGGAREIGEIDPEDFYDYQVNRPTISLDEAGVRRIEWRTTRLEVGQLGAQPRDVVLVRGIEPSIRWRGFTRELVEACRAVHASSVVLLGALLADAPHGRDIPVTGVSGSAEMAARLRLEPSTYAGPTGIVGVLAEALDLAGLPVVSYWASVPYYVSQPPNPKATLALLRRVEDALDTTIDVKDLPEEAGAWERAVDEMVTDDEELSEIVQQLEQQADSDRLESASGDSIAAEFERYLRRRPSDGPA